MAKRILVVDDQIEMLRMIGMNLETRGYQIEAAQDAPSALEKIRRSPPDLLILDIMLPGMSGTDLLRQIRSDPKLASLPVMILSALVQTDDKIAGLEAGADEYLTKPIDVRELVARVAAMLERSARLQPAGVQARGQVIAFLPAMGGIGTTGLTLNTAVALARSGAATVALSVQPSFSSFRAFLGYADSAAASELFMTEPGKLTLDLVRRSLVRHVSGIRVLEPPSPLEQPHGPVAEHAAALLDLLVQEAAFIHVDLRPMADDVTRVALERSTQVLLVAEPTPVCFDSAKAAVAFATRWGGAATRLACILVNRSAIAASLPAGDIERQLGIPVLATIPQAADALASAYKRGQLIVSHQPEQGVGEVVLRLAKTLSGSPT